MPKIISKSETPGVSTEASGGTVVRRKKFLVIGQLILVLVLVVPLVWGYVCQPLKYRYLIGRVETAKTAEEERAAFKLAANWGRLCEIDHVNAGDVQAKTRGLSGDHLVKVQWLNGLAAYRSLIDTNNLQILARKKYSHGITESFL